MSTRPGNSDSRLNREGGTEPLGSHRMAGQLAGTRWVSKALSAVGMAAVIIMMIHVVLEVGLRSFFNAPIPGTLEMVTYWYMVLISFVGMWLAQQRNEHISVTLLVDRLGLGARRVIAVAGYCLTAVVLVLFIWFGFEGALQQMAVGEFSGSSRIPIWPMRFVVPIALTAWLVALIAQAIATIRRPQVLDRESIDDLEVI